MQEARENLLKSPDAWRLAGMGFLTLFLELALIRYLPGNIWNLGYFPNLILIAVFIGMGVGFMFHHRLSTRGSTILVHASVWVLLVLLLFVEAFDPTVPGFNAWEGDIGGDLYFTSTSAKAAAQSNTPFIVCLVGVAAVFACLSQRTAKLFRTFRPLSAYTLDIAGSCAGILTFMLMSWLRAPAWEWFAIAIIGLLFAMAGSRRWRWLPLVPGAVIIGLVVYQDSVLLGKGSYKGPLESFWSPYQRIQHAVARKQIFVNGVGHQVMEEPEKIRAGAYQKVYDARRAAGEPPYRNVLILGAGSGNDVSAALMNGVEHVDAVEIDPVIADIGKRLHPAQPYADPRVNLVIDDGRAFMSRTPRRYDLIIFALTDSLVKVSSMSQLRLENYLFTVESVKRANSLLQPGGDLIFYNYYRQPWLRTKISEMIEQATGSEPQPIYELQDFAVLEAKSRPSQQTPADARSASSAGAFTPSLDLPRDDWPFLYLVERGIPAVYQWGMMAMAAFAALLVGLLHFSTRRLEHFGKPGMLATKVAFVFMGIAFTLLETKSVIQFSLLFGTTWLNSSLVFLAALLLVLVANWTAPLIPNQRVMPIIYAALIFSCLLTYVFPLGNLLAIESMALRFALAALLTFAPIFFANLVFSVSFRDLDIPEHVFGWNLIGATVGGVVEYSSMYFGYSFLAIVVAVSYAIVVALLVSSRRAQSQQASAEASLTMPQNAAL
jgi:hypothetical protein